MGQLRIIKLKALITGFLHAIPSVRLHSKIFEFMKKLFDQKLAFAAWVFLPMINLFFIYAAYLYNSSTQKSKEEKTEMNHLTEKSYKRSFVTSVETIEKEILN